METTPTTIRVPEPWRAAIEAAAVGAQQSQSEWILSAIFDALPKSVRKSLPAARGRGRPPKPAE